MKHAVVIGLAITSYYLSTDIYTPSMPEIARDFNETSDEVQRTMSYYLLGAILSTVLTGLFADKFGKKKFLLFGMGLAGLASVLTVFSPSLEWLILGRFLQGLGGAVAPVIGWAAIQDIYAEDEVIKIYAMLGVLFAGVPAVAPFFGGIISTYLGWHVIFIVIMILYAVSALNVWLVLPASLDKQSSNSSFEILSSYKEILSSRAFLILILPFPLYCSAEMFYLTFLPFYVQDQLDISAEFYGFAIGVLVIGFAAGSYFANKLMSCMGVHKTILTGLYLGIVAALMLWVTVFIFPKSLFAICLSLSIFLLGFGFLFPSLVSTSLNIFKEARTRASSIRGLFATSFSFLGSFSAEWADESRLTGLAGYVLICCILAFGIYQMRDREMVA